MHLRKPYVTQEPVCLELRSVGLKETVPETRNQSVIRSDWETDHLSSKIPVGDATQRRQAHFLRCEHTFRRPFHQL